MQALDFANYLAWAKCNCTYQGDAKESGGLRVQIATTCLQTSQDSFTHAPEIIEKKYPITFVEKFTPKIPATAWQRLDRMVTSVHLSKVTRSMPAWVWLRLPDSPPSWSMSTTSKHKCLCCWNKYELWDYSTSSDRILHDKYVDSMIVVQYNKFSFKIMSHELSGTSTMGQPDVRGLSGQIVEASHKRVHVGVLEAHAIELSCCRIFPCKIKVTVIWMGRNHGAVDSSVSLLILSIF